MTEEEATRLNNIRDSAKESLESSRSNLNEILDSARTEHAQIFQNINSWQTWLGAISFSLAAISGVVLTSNTAITSYWAFIATIVFLTTGLSIAISTKRRYEKESMEAVMAPNGIRPLFDQEMQVMLQMYEDPTRYEELRGKLSDARIAKFEYRLADYEIRVKEAEGQKVYYNNDIWIALMFTGTYLLLLDRAIGMVASWRLNTFMATVCVVAPWLMVMAFLAIDTVRSAKKVRLVNSAEAARLRREKVSTEETIAILKRSGNGQ